MATEILVANDLTAITHWDLTTGGAVKGNLQGQRLFRQFSARPR